jgi:hypothetical protein
VEKPTVIGETAGATSGPHEGKALGPVSTFQRCYSIDYIHCS